MTPTPTPPGNSDPYERALLKFCRQEGRDSRTWYLKQLEYLNGLGPVQLVTELVMCGTPESRVAAERIESLLKVVYSKEQS